jgi:hypothetical protein
MEGSYNITARSDVKQIYSNTTALHAQVQEDTTTERKNQNWILNPVLWIRIGSKADPDSAFLVSAYPGFWWPNVERNWQQQNFLIQNCNLLYFSLGLHKDVQATEEVFIPQKRHSALQNFKYLHFLWVILPSWIRIQSTKMNTDPCGSGSTTLAKILKKYLLNFNFSIRSFQRQMTTYLPKTNCNEQTGKLT